MKSFLYGILSILKNAEFLIMLMFSAIALNNNDDNFGSSISCLYWNGPCSIAVLGAGH